MDVVPSELITGRWKLNSSVCTIMCFGHIDSAAVCFNEGHTTTTSRSARGLQSSFLSAKRLHVRQMLILFFFFSSRFSSCRTQTAGFQETLTDVEILALIVGCVCHDLDHRGTNNAFQAK